jgi:hypothetical protein
VVKQHGGRLESDGWPHNLTLHNTPKGRDWYISNIWSYTMLTLMMETKDISETLGFGSTSTQLIAREDCNKFILDNRKTYIRGSISIRSNFPIHQ